MPKSRGRKKGRGPTPRKRKHSESQVKSAKFAKSDEEFAYENRNHVQLSSTGDYSDFKNSSGGTRTITPPISEELIENSWAKDKSQGYMYNKEIVAFFKGQKEFELISPDCNEENCLKTRRLRLSHDAISPEGMPTIKNIINDFLKNGAAYDAALSKKYVGLRSLDAEWELKSYVSYYHWCEDKLHGYLKKALFPTEESRRLSEDAWYDGYDLTTDQGLRHYIEKYLTKIYREVVYITQSQAIFQLPVQMTRRISEEYGTLEEWRELSGDKQVTMDSVKEFDLDPTHFGTGYTGDAQPLLPIITKSDLGDNWIQDIFTRRSSYWITHEDEALPSCLVSYIRKGHYEKKDFDKKYEPIRPDFLKKRWEAWTEHLGAVCAKYATKVRDTGQIADSIYANFDPKTGRKFNIKDALGGVLKSELASEFYRAETHAHMMGYGLPLANRDMNLWLTEEEAKATNSEKTTGFKDWVDSGGKEKMQELSRLSFLGWKKRSPDKVNAMLFTFPVKNFSILNTKGLKESTDTAWVSMSEEFQIGVTNDLCFWFNKGFYHTFDQIHSESPPRAIEFYDSIIGLVMNISFWLNFISQERIEYVKSKKEENDKQREKMGLNAPDFDEDAITEEYEQKWISCPMTVRKSYRDDRKPRKEHQGGTHASPYPHVGLLKGDRYKKNPTYAFYKPSHFAGIKFEGGVNIDQNGEWCAYRINWPKDHPKHGSKDLNELRNEQSQYIHDRSNLKSPKNQKRQKRVNQVLTVNQHLKEVREAADKLDQKLSKLKSEPANS